MGDGCASSLNSQPWPALKSHFVFLHDKLRINGPLLQRMFERNMLTKDDYDDLSSDRLTHRDKLKILLTQLLPARPETEFPVFCQLLRDPAVGQPHVADCLEGK